MRGMLHSPSDDCLSPETGELSPDSTPESYPWQQRGREREGEKGEREWGKRGGYLYVVHNEYISTYVQRERGGMEGGRESGLNSRQHVLFLSDSLYLY